MATMQFKRQMIGVAINPNDREERHQIPALVLGALGIHGGLGGEDGLTPGTGYYVVTHIPSGYKMAEAYKQRSCRALVEKLAALPVDWNFTAKQPSDSWFQYAQPILREFNSTIDR